MAAGTSYNVKAGGTIKSVTKGTSSTVGTGDLLIFIGQNVDLGKRQQIVGSLQVLKRYLHDHLVYGKVPVETVWDNAITATKGTLQIASTDAAVSMDDVCIRVENTFKPSPGASHFVDTGIDTCINAFLEDTKAA